MRRIIFCPNEDFVDEATELSKRTLLQIQIGESQTTENINFNREIVSVVSIPSKNQVVYKSSVENSFHQIVNYHNDFILFDDSVHIKSMNNSIYPIVLEKHYARFAYVCNSHGRNSFDIVFNDRVMESLVFDVY
jgi:hypothetical protein